MKKRILVRGPILSQSGYGEQARFALRSLRTREDIFDIYVDILNWGKTGWVMEETEERRWIDSLSEKTGIHQHNKGTYDASLQITIPNEWEKLAPINIGYTAGIESNLISPAWFEKSDMMDKIIVVSNHAKHGFDTTVLDAIDKQTGQKLSEHKVTTPVESVNYCFRTIEPSTLDLELETEFNFLVVAQRSTRKNIDNTVKWFLDEFQEDETVGLVLKTNEANNTVIDRAKTIEVYRKIVKQYPDKKCKVYLIHGDMTEEEIHGLYTHPKIKAFLTLTHGEGFGLPIFEAATVGLPIIAPDWSGHCDFLYVPAKTKKGKKKNKPLFATVDYNIANIQPESVWPGVLEKESKWCFPIESKAKAKMREVYKDHNRFKSWARKLQKHIKENFTEEKMYDKFVQATGLDEELPDADYVFVSDAFAHQYTGGAELSFQTLIDKCPGTSLLINSQALSENVLDFYKDKTWVFANIASVPLEFIKKISASNLSYYVSESDFKFCEHRLPQLCQVFNGGAECECGEGDRGHVLAEFYNNSKLTFFRSEKQKQLHMEALKLKKHKVSTLSALFPEEFFKFVATLREKYSDKKSKNWVVSSSPSWVKGSGDSEKWCKDNSHEYTKVHGKPYGEVLELLAQSRGLSFLPKGYDTCPRLVIEAVLLGCEVNINDNVLHATESWFKDLDIEKIEEHLRKQPDRFWNVVENAA